MGFGNYSHAAHEALLRDRASIPTQDVFAQRSCHPLMNPNGVRVREARDSADHPNSIGIVFALDVTGSMADIPEMLARKRGHLVALSSLASYRGLPKMAGYCASKAGVSALMDTMRLELKPYGIAATTICPGWVRTPMTSKFNLPLPGLLELDDAVNRIVKAIRQRRAQVAFPRSSALRVRLLRWLPSAWSDWLLWRMFERLVKKSSPG